MNDFVIKSRKDFDESKIIYKNIVDHNFNFTQYFENTTKGINYYENGLSWAKLNGNIDDIIFAKNSILGFYIKINNNIEKIARIRDLLKYKEVYDSFLIRDLLYDLKQAYRQTEQFNDFLAILPEYHKYSKIYGYKEIGEDNYDCEIAFVNYRLKNYEKAIESYKKCSEYLALGKKFFPQSSTINNIGLCFSNLKKIDSAKFYYTKAIEVIVKYKRENSSLDFSYVNHFLNVINSNIVSLDSSLNNLDNKLSFYYKELKSGKEFNEKNIISSAYYNIANVFYAKKMPRLTLQYLDSTFMILSNYNAVRSKEKSLHLKAKTLLHQGYFKEANSAFSTYEKFSDSIETEKAKKNYLLGAIKHETEVRTKELTESRILNEEEIKKVQYLIIGLILTVIFLFSFLFFYLKSRKKNKIIKKQKEDLNGALKEKEVLLKEIHHRVKNNLQVVSGLLLIQSKKKTNLNFNEILIQSQRQIESMSLVHEMLYQKENLSKINSEEYFKKLGKNLLNNYPEIEAKININTNKNEINIDLANPLGLILNELITNSFKHGFKKSKKGKITIGLYKENNHYIFVYKDNGKGIDLKDPSNNSNKFGNRLIKSLAEEINATIEMKNEKGLTYILKFKQKE